MFYNRLLSASKFAVICGKASFDLCVSTGVPLAPSMASSTPPFDPSGTRYDQKTYSGRLSHFREMVSPSTLLVGDAELAARVDLLERHARGAAPEASDADLWDAKRIKDAIIHPTTGEKMFLPGRMSAFVPQHGSKCRPGCCVSSGSAGWLWAASDTQGERPGLRPSSHCLTCSSQPPIPPPFTIRCR